MSASAALDCNKKIQLCLRCCIGRIIIRDAVVAEVCIESICGCFFFNQSGKRERHREENLGLNHLRGICVFGSVFFGGCCCCCGRLRRRLAGSKLRSL
jgi:hypothetical protein